MIGVRVQTLRVSPPGGIPAPLREIRYNQLLISSMSIRVNLVNILGEASVGIDAVT